MMEKMTYGGEVDDGLRVVGVGVVDLQGTTERA
jgi:hypothetical protein